MLVTRIATVMIALTLALPAWAQVTFVPTENTATGIAGRNNTIDATGTGSCAFDFGATPTAGNPLGFQTLGCRDVFRQPCPAGDVPCNLERVPQGRCSQGDNASCVWPSGAGFCASDGNLGCETDADCAVLAPAPTTCDLSSNIPACVCNGTDPSAANFETNPGVCGGDRGICSDGDPQALTGTLGGGLCAPVNTVGNAGGGANPDTSNCGFQGGQALTGSRAPIETPSQSATPFRKPGYGGDAPGGAIRDIRGMFAVELGPIEDGSAGTRNRGGIRRTRLLGDSFLLDYSWADNKFSGAAVDAAITNQYCALGAGWQSNFPSNNNCADDPGTPGVNEREIFCTNDADCPQGAGSGACDRAVQTGTPPGAPGDGTLGTRGWYCHENPTNSLGYLYTQDINPADAALLPPTLDIDGDTLADCPPHCGLNYDRHTLEEEAIIELADPGTGSFVAATQVSFDHLGTETGSPKAGDQISLVQLWAITFIRDQPVECFIGGDPSVTGATCSGGTCGSCALVGGNANNCTQCVADADCAAAIGRCSISPVSCDPGTRIGNADCGSVAPAGQTCEPCYGPYDPLGSMNLNANVPATDPNPLALPVGYNTYGLEPLKAWTRCPDGGGPGIDTRCDSTCPTACVAGRVGGIGNLSSKVVTPLAGQTTTGWVASETRDTATSGALGNDDAPLGLDTLGASGIGTGGTLTAGTIVPVDPPADAAFPGMPPPVEPGGIKATVTWQPETISELVSATPSNTPMRLGSWGPGPDAVPGCIFDASQAAPPFSGATAGACNEALGLTNAFTGTVDAAINNTGDDDMVAMFDFADPTFAAAALPEPGPVPALRPRGKSPNPAAARPTGYSNLILTGVDVFVQNDADTDFSFRSEGLTCPVADTGFVQCVCPFGANCPDDTDNDGWIDPGQGTFGITTDGCPTVPNIGDADGDGVDDACDTCLGLANPAVANPTAVDPAFPAGWMTLVSGQRDDDADGAGNACDADFDQAGAVVGGTDLGLQRAAFNQNVAGVTCGGPCDVFDMDEVGALIGGTDLSLGRAAFNTQPGPACDGPDPDGDGIAEPCDPNPGAPSGTGTPNFFSTPGALTAGRAVCEGPACP